MKKLIVNNWVPKLMCLIVAIAVWVLVHHYIHEDVPSRQPEIIRSQP